MSEMIHNYEDYYSAAMRMYYAMNEEKSWEILFLYEFNSDPSNYPPSRPDATARQKEQRKLASQLRSVTRMIASGRYLYSNVDLKNKAVFSEVIGVLQMVEHSLRKQMSTIKERIPA